MLDIDGSPGLRDRGIARRRTVSSHRRTPVTLNPNKTRSTAGIGIASRINWISAPF
jgi:hypothetical protein